MIDISIRSLLSKFALLTEDSAVQNQSLYKQSGLTLTLIINYTDFQIRFPPDPVIYIFAANPRAQKLQNAIIARTTGNT